MLNLHPVRRRPSLAGSIVGPASHFVDQQKERYADRETQIRIARKTDATSDSELPDQSTDSELLSRER